ncbi:hypothetical protein LMG28614_06875 [Paraburkholderia ultramafica]|uniref:RNA-binding protein n=1 Tax=Paraburkholderia ultramafica TaxID=1544867 RepID=A0A6S7D6R4_9BURK|nr:RNA-binding protein [Paraburkholderia ultramafica]CAB3808761.1 hypothetical protein LMG28614_06875 [Paraburkholderia ultramafica]
MADLLVDNIDADIADDDIKELLVKYGFPVFDGIEHILGDGSRPAVLLTFEGVDPEFLRHLQSRVHNLFWKNRRITVQVMTDRSE